MFVLSALLGAGSAASGMFASALFNLPSGPSIVVAQLVLFLGAICVPRLLIFRASKAGLKGSKTVAERP